MELTGLTLLFVFSILFSMAYNYGFPKFQAALGANPTFQKYQGSYASSTLVTAVAVFGLLVGVSFVMSFAFRKPSLPSA